MSTHTLNDVRVAFENNLHTKRDLSLHTIRAYVGDLESFFKLLPLSTVRMTLGFLTALY